VSPDKFEISIGTYAAKSKALDAMENPYAFGRRQQSIATSIAGCIQSIYIKTIII
jgi:hypothetical protein